MPDLITRWFLNSYQLPWIKSEFEGRERLQYPAGQGQAEGSYEYLVFNSTLLGVAAEHGLQALTEWDDAELDDCFDEVPSLQHPLPVQSAS